MTRVTFGDTPSPFLSIATIKKHAKEHENKYPKAAEEVKDNMYVDDLLTGALEDESALQLKEDLQSLFSKGGFELTKWAPNSQKSMESMPLHERAPSLVPSLESEKMSGVLEVLGTSWNTHEDVLILSSGSEIAKEDDPTTKRSLISLYAMGLLTPFLLTPKLLFQELWARDLNWDDPLDVDIAQAWGA